MRETRAEKISTIPIEEVSKMKETELKKLVGQLEMGYKRRVGAFKRQGLVSQAQLALEGQMTDKRPTSKLTRNQALLRFALYQKFFKGMTSTVSGIKEVNLQQDIRLFGVDEEGKPRYRMNQAERTAYWKLYEEYQRQEPSKFVNYGYNVVQEAIVQMQLSGAELTSENLMSQIDKLSEILQGQYYEANIGSVPNVYSGRGPTFTE